MIEIYWTKNKDVHRKVEILLERKIGKGFEIKRTENGKPYIVGNPLYFSVSHSSDRAVIAIADKPVGIDLERYKKRNFSHILSRFTPREKEWIGNNSAFFFMNWISKEAYIKMIGGTIAHDLKRLEYADYKLYCDGKEPDCGYTVIAGWTAGIFAICADGYTADELFLCDLKLFRLKKGEHI